MFGDIQATPASPTPLPSTNIQPLPDKKESLLGALAPTDNTPLFDTSKVPEKSVVSQEVSSVPSSSISEKTESILDTSGDQSLSELPEILPEESVSSPVVKMTLPTESISEAPEKTIEITEALPVIKKVETSPITLADEVSLSGTKIDQSSVVPMETLEKQDQPPVPETPKKEPDTKLAQYLQADGVYQDMMRMEGQEKIRLQLAIRYTFVMFAIFLVFAWIVSNRIIMFGFSEFVWLARIRDGLFAFMA